MSDSEKNSALDLPLVFAVFSVVAILIASLMSGELDSPAKQPNENRDYYQTEPGRASAKIQQYASDQEQSRADDKAPDRWMVKLTFLIIVISALQLWMFYSQWRVMREGLGDTKKAADAAFANAEAARKSSEALPRMERAYLFLNTKSKSVIQEFDFADFDTRSSIDFGFINHGRTPAIVEALLQNGNYFPEGMFPKIDQTMGGAIPKGLAISGENASSGWGIMFPIGKEEFALARKNKGNIFFWGKIVYLDVFGATHETGWCRAYKFEEEGFRFYEAGDLNYYT